MEKKEIQVFYEDVSDCFNGDLATLLERLRRHLPMHTNPERMTIEANHSSYSSEIWVTGYRMETDEECARRIDAEQAYMQHKIESDLKEQRQREAAEYEHYIRLHKKFGVKNS